MAARLAAFVIWGAIAASALFWLLRLGVQAPGVPPHAVGVGDAAAVRADLSRLLGINAAPPPDAVVEAPPPADGGGRYRLVGVVAPRQANRLEGVALIAVDGKPPRAYRVGAIVEGATVLQRVQARGVELGPRGGVTEVRLELPPLPPPNTGTLPPAANGMPAGFPAPPPAAYAPPPAYARPIDPQGLEMSPPAAEVPQIPQMQRRPDPNQNDD